MGNDPRRPVIVVTGASAGIGRAAALALAPKADLALVGRDRGRLDAALEAVREAGSPNAQAFQADYARLDDVRDLAAALRERYERIDVLANNAGLIAMERTETVDGYESTIQVNHLAGFLLANLLRDRLEGGRVITTSSDAHRAGRLEMDGFEGPPKFGKWRLYANSKQANILFAREAARRWPDVYSATFHPGTVRSNFGDDSGLFRFAKKLPFFISPEQGADTLVWLATTDVSELTPGGYYIKRALKQPHEASANDRYAASLWDSSLGAVGLGPADPA